jgi:hypothetical protein
VNRWEAKEVIAQGFTYEALRDLLRPQFDGALSKVIDGFTMQQTHFLVSGCIDKKYGLIHPQSHDALVAEIALREFSNG